MADRTNRLQSYFPLIRTREDILGEIRSNPRLLSLYQSWTGLQQQEFLDFCSGAKGIKITYDSFFKEALSPEYSPERLGSMLGAFLGFPVRIVAVLPNDSTRISDEGSLLITDIVVELEDGSLANVEIQKIGYAFPGERCACYGADLLLRQYKRARDQRGKSFSYSDLKNVYLIVIFEESPKELKASPDTFIRRGETVFTGNLKMNMLQKYVFVSLDIYKETMQNKPIGTLQEAWAAFLGYEEPDRIVELITAFPEFKALYETVYQMCRNMEDVMGIFSEELKIMDRNTVHYMIDELNQEVNAMKAEIADKDAQIAALTAEITRLMKTGGAADSPARK